MRLPSCRWLLLLPMLMALALLTLAGCGSAERTQGAQGTGRPALQRTGLLIDPTEAERVGYSVNWISSLDVPRRQRITAAVVLDDLIVTLEQPANMITAVSVGDGRVRWRHVLDRSPDPLQRPSREGDRIYINSATRLFTLDADSGDVRHVLDLPTTVAAPHTLVNGHAIVGGVNGRVYGIHLESGQIRWTRQLRGRITAPPADAGDTTVAVDESGRYAMYHALDGRRLWDGRTFGRNTATPAVGEELVYVASHDQTLYALDRATGRDRWAHRETSALSIDPLLIGDTLFVPVLDEQRTVALDAVEGSVRWQFDDVAIPMATPRDDRVLMITPQLMELVRLSDGRVLEDAQTRPLITALAGPDLSLLLVAPNGQLVRLNPRR